MTDLSSTCATVVTLLLSSVSFGCAGQSSRANHPLAEYQAPEPTLPTGIAPSSRGGIVLGVVTSSCKGEPLHALVRIVSGTGDTTLVRTDDRGSFTAGPMSPGTYVIQFQAIASESQRRTTTLAVGRIDTVRVVLKFNDALVTEDCWFERRSSGSQFCPPKGPTEC